MNRLVCVSTAVLVLVGCSSSNPSASDGEGGVGDASVHRDTSVDTCTCFFEHQSGPQGLETFRYGCREDPLKASFYDVPANCWSHTLDPQTGCKVPGTKRWCPKPEPTCTKEIVGKPCSAPDYDCDQLKTGAICITTSKDGSGFCTCQCDPASSKPCPDATTNSCRPIELTNGDAYLCFKRCEPRLGANDCAADLACDPKSQVLDPLEASAFCLFPACKKDSDCPISTERACRTDGTLPCPAKERCIPRAPDQIDGTCARAGRCDLPSGLCAPRREHFAPTAKIGAPCISDLDCGANQRCEREIDFRAIRRQGGEPCTQGDLCCSRRCTGGSCETGLCTVHARNGYCVTDGCAFPKLTHYQCPAGSGCSRRYAGGRCLKRCTLGDAASCRGHGADKLGDYECRDFSATSPALADGPLCEFGDAMGCAGQGAESSLLPSHGVGCAALGGLGNSTLMSCRDLGGAELPNAKAPLGLCLDDSASGPVAP